MEEKQEQQVKESKATNIGSRDMSIASIILGVMAVVMFNNLYVSLTTAILAIVFGAIGCKRESRGLALAGLILGIITVILYVYTILGVINIYNLMYPTSFLY